MTLWKSNFKELKEARCMTLKEIASLSGVSISGLQNMQDGLSVSLARMVPVCIALECSLDDLVTILPENSNGN